MPMYRYEPRNRARLDQAEHDGLFGRFLAVAD